MQVSAAIAGFVPKYPELLQVLTGIAAFGGYQSIEIFFKYWRQLRKWDWVPEKTSAGGDCGISRYCVFSSATCER